MTPSFMPPWPPHRAPPIGIFGGKGVGDSPRIAQVIFEANSFTKIFDSMVFRMVH